MDPGDRYTGVAIFEKDDIDDTWDCVDAFTIDRQSDNEPGNPADLFEDYLASTTARGEWDIIGFEVWRLFEDKAQEQKGSQFVASQLIGVIKHIARRNRWMNRWPRQALELVEFLPDHKKATRGVAESRGYTWEADRRANKGDHARDAEIQGYRDLSYNRGWTVKRKAPQ